MRNPVDLVGGFYTDDSLPWSCQDTVNYIPVASEVAGTRTVSKLVDAPGLRPWQWIGNFENGVESAPIRGLHDVEGQLFVVCGRTLYQISNAGVAIPRGTIPGVGRVSMAHNQRSTGNELIVVNGSGGYVWNTGTQTFSVVTDAGYPGASVVDFIDGYLMQVEPFGRFLFHSDLADALEYNTLDRFEAETAPDRTLGMIVNHQEVWAFGERTIDVFGNAGTAQGTFQNKGVSISRGCAAKWTPAVIDNGVAWLGDDLKVYHAAGYSPVRISTRAIEVALSECSQTDLRNAFSFVWEDLSHAVYYLTIPNGPTFGFDFSTRLWHRRASWHPERDISGRWRINDLVRHNGKWIGGDYQNGKLYVLDWDYMLEGCEPLVRERVSPVAHNDGHGFTVDSAEVFFDTGGKETECVEFPHQPRGPSISGEAPDGDVDEAYTYSYTVSPGDSPVGTVELVGTTLPDGWEWDPLTATISNASAPLSPAVISLRMRAVDANGLWAEHSDVFSVEIAYQILFTGSPATGTSGFAWSKSISPLSIGVIPSESGSNLADAVPAFYGGTWVAAGIGSLRYASDISAWSSASTPWATHRAESVVGGPDGWLILSNSNIVSGAYARAPQEPASTTAFTWSWGVDTIDHATSAMRVGDRYFFTWSGAQSGWLLSSGSLSGVATKVCDESTSTPGSTGNNAIRGFFDVVEFEGALIASVVKSTNDARPQLRRSVDGGATWPDILYDTQLPQHSPYQLQVCGDVLLVYCWGGEYVLTSADGFAGPHPTGIGYTRKSSIRHESHGRYICASGSRFFLVSGAHSDPDMANKCVTTVDGLTFSEPVPIPLINVNGIAINYGP